MRVKLTSLVPVFLLVLSGALAEPSAPPADEEPSPMAVTSLGADFGGDPALGALRQRRLELVAREAALELRALELRAIESRIEARIDVLAALAGDVKDLLAERDEIQMTRLKRMARTYEAMRPAQAATLFDQLDPSLRIAIARQMRQTKLGPVLARMVPENATRLTDAMMNTEAQTDQGS